MSRLPVVGSDDGTWGTVLNDFLQVSHNADGTNIDVQRVATKSSDYTLTIADTVILANTALAGLTLTLPQASSVSGKIFRLKNIGANILTIVPAGSDTIDGSASIELTHRYTLVDVASNGTNYYII